MADSGATRYGYSPGAVAMHWLTAVLVLAAFVMGPGGSEQRVYSTAKDFDRQVHEILGLSVFALTLVRLPWRALAPAPQLPPTAKWMHNLSRTVHALLYVLLVATPISAITGAWLEGHPLTLGLLGNVPPMIPENRTVGQKVAELHTTLGDVVIWLAGLHALAALVHHFLLRDQVLFSMLPARWRPPPDS